MDIPHLKKYKGKNHSQWKGGRLISSFGYILIYSPKHPNKNKMGKGYVTKHRLVMEKHIGRYLTKTEVIHHINGIKSDNRIENLELTTASKHVAEHKSKEICSNKTKAIHRKNMKKLIRGKNGRIIGKKR